MIRVLPADHQAMVREGHSALRGAPPDTEVVGAASDGREPVARGPALRPVVAPGDALLAPSVTRRLIESFVRAQPAEAVIVAYESGLVSPNA